MPLSNGILPKKIKRYPSYLEYNFIAIVLTFFGSGMDIFNQFYTALVH